MTGPFITRRELKGNRKSSELLKRFDADALGRGSMFDAVWTASLEPMTTRREVRGFLARTLIDLIGAQTGRDSTVELSSLATGSDREVIESYRRLEKSCEALSAKDAKYGGIVVSLNVRDLFARGLSRMKELPPDPRETLHVKPAFVGTSMRRRSSL